MTALLAPFRRLMRRFSSEPTWIEPEALRARMTLGQKPTIIDVRNREEFDGPLGHIDGARNIPLPVLRGAAPDLATMPAPIVLVCLTDLRSSRGALELAQAGLRDVAVLRGGMKAWRETAG